MNPTKAMPAFIHDDRKLYRGASTRRLDFARQGSISRTSARRLQFARQNSVSRSLLSILSEDGGAPDWTFIDEDAKLAYSTLSLPDWILRWIFVVLYVLQVIGSVWFLYWVGSIGWNHASPITSGLFMCTEVVAFISSTFFLFCGVLWIFPADTKGKLSGSATGSDTESNTEDSGPATTSFHRISEEAIIDEEIESSKVPEDTPDEWESTWIRRKMLSSLMPQGTDDWKAMRNEIPVVAVCVCRYKEPLEDLLQTVECMSRIEWPGRKLQLFILDDGWYANDDEYHQLQARELTDLLNIPSLGTYAFESCLGPSRPDCATECTFWTIQSSSRSRPEITLIARKKPKISHYKAGNVNNFLYNYLGHTAMKGGRIPEFMLLLDHDMLVHKDIIKDAFPRLIVNPNVAFVQYPQRFYDISGADRLYAGNEIFFDGVQINRSLAGVAAFAGTNAVWNLQALYHVGGFQYGSLTEDASTGLAVNAMGYLSLYCERELAIGQSPQTVEDAMQQRMRWSQGAVEIFTTYLSAFVRCRSALSYVEPPSPLRKHFAREKPEPPSRARRTIMSIIYLDSMVYPLYSMGFLIHVVVAFLYLLNVQAPMAPADPRQMLYIWLPLYIVKAGCQVLAFPNVSLAAQWNSQMAWAGYSLSTLSSVQKALCSGGGSWFNTGATKKNRFLLQYGNTVIALVLYLMIIYRAIAFVAIDKTCSAWTSVGALLYGLVMITHVREWALMPFRRKPTLQDSVEGESNRLNTSMRFIPSESTRETSTEWHQRAHKKSVQAREEHHSFDLSIFVVFFHVVLLSFLLFFWASDNCDGFGSTDADSPSKIELPTPLLPNNIPVTADFVVRNGTVLLNGKPFDIKGINWFGFETESNMVFGLDKTGQDTVLAYLVEHGFNSIRLPLTAESILSPSDYAYDPDLVSVDPHLNAHLDTTNYLTAVSTFVEKAASWGVFVLLDMHRLRHDKATYELPYDEETPFSDVKNAWSVLSREFCYQWAVMGADLFNEPHGVTWGTGAETDWRLLAEELAEEVSTHCPRWLIFVEGMADFNDPSENPLWGPFAQWGSFLREADQYPVRVPNPEKLVYSPHLYGPGTLGLDNLVWRPCDDTCHLCSCRVDGRDQYDSCPAQETFEDLINRTNSDCTSLLPLSDSPFPQNMYAVWDFLFGDIQLSGKAIVVGEWGGTFTDRPTNPRLDPNTLLEVRALETRWNEAFESYLQTRKLGSFYWSLNPESIDTGGLLEQDWMNRNTAKEALLRRLPASDPIPILFPNISKHHPILRCLDQSEVPLLSEGSPRFERESFTFNQALDYNRKTPNAIVFPDSEEAVSTVVQCATAYAVPICIRSGGNSYTGDSSCDGLLVDVRNLRRFDKVGDNLFWVGSGYTSGELVSKLSEHDQVVPVGHHGGVAAGFFFGCGHGRLSREYGLGCDSILEARVVLANGTIVTAQDDGEFSDLMWALRGSGAHHFGVVTSLLFKTHDVEEVNEAVSFRYEWPRNLTKDAIRVWQDWVPSNPISSFSCDLMIFNVQSETGAVFQGSVYGTRALLDEIFDPVFSRLGPPSIADVQESTYLEDVATQFGVPGVYDIRDPYAGHSGARRSFLNKAHIIDTILPDVAIDKLVGLADIEVPGAAPYDNYIQFKAFGGQIVSSPRPNCFPYRGSLGLIQYGGYWDDVANRETMTFHQRHVHTEMSTALGIRSFYNYKDNDLREGWEVAYWGEDFASQLLALKCNLDPKNILSSAQQSIRCMDF